MSIELTPRETENPEKPVREQYLKIAAAILAGLLIILVGIFGIPRLKTMHDRAVARAYRAKMLDPVYRREQTIKYQPSVEREIKEKYPQAIIKPYPHAEPGKFVYEVHLPDGDGRELPRLTEHLCHVCGKYYKQGYKATILIYHEDRIIKALPEVPF
ncbi:MAG TPA: hypothetical protein PLZ36_07145 [Armatimonadota bacterium]|nr:hypothetical protein [Armatimonadota bacterium]